MKAAGAVLMAAGIVLAVLFACVIPKKVLNIGNILGLALSAFLFLLGRYLPKVLSFFSFCWGRNAAGRAVVIMLLGAAGLILCLMIVMSVKMVQAIHREPAEGAVLIVLGCQVKGEKPSLALSERIDAAYAYLTEHPEARAILSGGKGNGERISEAECMYRELTGRGIAPERLCREDQSKTTRENLAFSKKILEEEHLSREAALVTNEFHVYRSLLIAEKEGLSAGAVPAKTKWYLLPTFWMREFAGILYEWQFGI